MHCIFIAFQINLSASCITLSSIYAFLMNSTAAKQSKAIQWLESDRKRYIKLHGTFICGLPVSRNCKLSLCHCHLLFYQWGNRFHCSRYRPDKCCLPCNPPRYLMARQLIALCLGGGVSISGTISRTISHYFSTPTNR